VGKKVGAGISASLCTILSELYEVSPVAGKATCLRVDIFQNDAAKARVLLLDTVAACDIRQTTLIAEERLMNLGTV